MTDENPKITFVKKEKDPKRVEAGKKLAAISKEAKENKMHRKIEEERMQIEKENDWNIDYKYLIGVVVLLLLYFSYFKSNGEKQNNNEEKELKDKPKNEKKNNAWMDEPSFKFDTLD